MGKAQALDPGRFIQTTGFEPDPSDLILFVLNVGDGDSLVLRFPADAEGNHEFAVIDCNDAQKTIDLLDVLGARRLRFVCATHPHLDHIRGLRDVIDHVDEVDAFWDSGFRYTSSTYNRLIRKVVEKGIAFQRMTSGYELYIGRSRVTVLSPSINLRNRFDTYGVDVNNSSIILRISYPEHPPSNAYPAKGEEPGAPPKARTMILGGDAQTDAWSRVLEEFPHFHKDASAWAQQIGARSGRQPLACDLLKVSHHGSKRGINLELIERFGDTTGSGPSDGPRLLVTSSASGEDSRHGFPHAVTQALMREVRDPQATKDENHKPDGELGIHNTAQVITGEGPAGSVAFVITANAGRRLFRFTDGRDDPVVFSDARKVRGLR